jgi:outer membrane protein assembly factor BamB
MQMTRNWIFAGLGVLFLGGCSWFSWIPGIGDEPDPLEPRKLVKFDAEVKINRLWKRSVGEGLGRKYLRLQPVVLADRIYAGDGYGRLQAHDRFTGKRIWQSKFEGDDNDGGFFSSLNFIDRKDPSFVSGGIGAGGGRILVGTTSGEVVAFAAGDGVEEWRSNVGSEVLAPPITGDDMVFVQTIDGRLLALEQDSGEIRWSYDIQVPVLTLRGTATPVYDGGVVYAGFANGTMSAVIATNGQPIWEHRLMLPEGRSELDRMVDVDASPLVRGPLVYGVAYQGKVKALRRSDGQGLWELDISSYLDIGEGYGYIYLVDDEDTIVAIDQQSAEEVWRQDGLARRKLSSPVVFSNYVAVGDADGYLHIIAQSDGRFLARRKLDGDGLRSSMVYTDGTLYVLGNSGSLHALEITVR